jgi:acetate kinase
VLISGHAEISMTDNTGTRSVVSQLGAGDVFGVMSLLTGDRIVADVIAGNRCFVLMIPQEVFNTHILTNPKAVAYLSRLLADRTRAMSLDQASTPARLDDPYALSLHTNSRARSSPSTSASARSISASTTPRKAAPTCMASSTTPTSRSPASPSWSDRIRRPWARPVQALRPVPGDAGSTRCSATPSPSIPEDVTAVGHRVVHGGNKFSSSVVITPR